MTIAAPKARIIFLLDGTCDAWHVAPPMNNTASPRRKFPRVRRHYLEHRIADSKTSREALNRFAASVKTMRAASGLSLTQLAAQVGCSFKQIHNLEHALCWPSMPVYLSLCRVFKQPTPPMV